MAGVSFRRTVIEHRVKVLLVFGRMTVLRCIRVRRRRTLLADVRGDHVRAGW